VLWLPGVARTKSGGPITVAAGQPCGVASSCTVIGPEPRPGALRWFALRTVTGKLRVASVRPRAISMRRGFAAETTTSLRSSAPCAAAARPSRRRVGRAARARRRLRRGKG